MDPSRLNAERDKDVIIPRALYFTNRQSFQADIARLETLYTQQEILIHLRNTKELISNEVCSMVAERYHVPPFRRLSIK